MSQTRKRFENFQKNVKTLEKIVSKQNQRIVELKKKFEKKKNEFITQLETQMTINQLSRFQSWKIHGLLNTWLALSILSIR